jgi:hypothetical protein
MKLNPLYQLQASNYSDDEMTKHRSDAYHDLGIYIITPEMQEKLGYMERMQLDTIMIRFYGKRGERRRKNDNR